MASLWQRGKRALQGAALAWRGYEAARRDGPNARWLPPDGPEDLLLARDARTIRARARAIVRDNPNMGGALDKIVNNVVFGGIRPQAQIMRGGAAHKAANDRVETLWERWQAANNLWECQCLAVRHLWQDGGFFVHRFADPELLDQGLPPLGIELVDINALDTGRDEDLADGRRVRRGMEFDRRGRVRAYYLFENSLFRQDGDLTWFGQSRRLAVEDCRLVMVKKRIGQTLPVSWLASAIMAMHDFDQYQSAERMAARLAAAFVMYLKTDGVVGGNDLGGNPWTGGQTTDGSLLNDFIGSGRLTELPAGKSIEVAENKRPAANYDSYTKTSLRGVSSATGMSYGSFANDPGDANYSSMRQAVLEERRGYRMQQFIVSSGFMQPVWDWFEEYRYLFGLGRERFVPVRWQYSGWGWVDPVKDATAAEIRIHLAIATRRDVCAEQGLDWDDVIHQLAAEKKIMLELGITDADVSEAVKRREPEDRNGEDAQGRGDGERDEDADGGRGKDADGQESGNAGARKDGARRDDGQD